MKKIIAFLFTLAVCMFVLIGTAAADMDTALDKGVERMECKCVIDPVSLPCKLKETKVTKPIIKQHSTYSASSGNCSAKEWIAQRESGGDYNAVSPSGKYIGRYQLSKDKLGGDYSPENQERVAEQYVKSRYGSWEKAKEHWERFGWY